MPSVIEMDEIYTRAKNGKAASRSSIRDNLTRFSRRDKRYSKKLDMLNSTLLLYFHCKQFRITIK